MNAKLISKQETRIALLEKGMEIMLEKGYSNSGIQEILSALQVPKGSFYHYFESKESYGVEIIRYYDQSYTACLTRTLQNNQLTPIERLKDYCLSNTKNLAARECRKGCLIGNLSQEMADQSEVLRQELSSVMGKWRSIVAACIKEGQEKGEIKRDWQPEAIAEIFLSGWSGAMMRAKTVKNTEPLETFMSLLLDGMLRA